MSSSNRRDRYSALVTIAAIIAVVLIAWFNQPSGPPIRKPNTEAPQAEGDGGEPLTKRIYWGLFTADDTIAQWFMALFTIAATGVSLKAVFLVRDTLELNREATAAALKAAEHSAEANAIMSQQQRPWLELRFKGRTPPIQIDDVTVTASYEVNAVNVGTAPAINIKAVQLSEPFIMEVGHKKWLDKVEQLAMSQTYARPVLFVNRSIMAAGNGGNEKLDTTLYVAVAYQISGSNKWFVSSGGFRIAHYVKPGEPIHRIDEEPHVGPITLARLEEGRFT